MKKRIVLFICFCCFFFSISSTGGNIVKRYNNTKLVTRKFCRHLDFEINRGVIILHDVQIAGSSKRYNFILDTGSSYTLVSKEVALEIGFMAESSTVITDGFESKSIELGLMDFKVGEIEFSHVGVGIIDNSPIEKLCNIDGYIGYNLMKSCIWKLGLGEIIISDDIKNIEDLGDYHAQKLNEGPTVVAGFSNGFNSTMLFDLGDNGAVEIHESRISLIKEKEMVTGTGKLYSTGLGDGNKTEESIQKLLKVPSFTLGNGRVESMIVYTDDSPLLPIDVIGAEILNYFNIVIDFPGKKFYSLNISEEYGDRNFMIHGFKYEIVGGSIYVSFVWDGSSAYKSGIRVGQQISMINGLSTSELCLFERCKAHEWMQSAFDNDSITLTLAGSDNVVVLSKAPLFKGEN